MQFWGGAFGSNFGEQLAGIALGNRFEVYPLWDNRFTEVLWGTTLGNNFGEQLWETASGNRFRE
jgi:hypothetical protein